MDTSGNIRELSPEAPLRSDETLLTSRLAQRLLRLPQDLRVEAHRQQAARAGTSHLWRCDQRNGEGNRCRNHIKHEGKHSAFGKVW